MTAKPMTKARMTNADAVRNENADFPRGVDSRGASGSASAGLVSRNTNLAPPNRTSCPSASEAGLSVMRVSPTKVPLLDFASTNSHRRLRRLTIACCLETVGSRTTTSFDSSLPIDVWGSRKMNSRDRASTGLIASRRPTVCFRSPSTVPPPDSSLVDHLSPAITTSYSRREKDPDTGRQL